MNDMASLHNASYATLFGFVVLAIGALYSILLQRRDTDLALHGDNFASLHVIMPSHCQIFKIWVVVSALFGSLLIYLNTHHFTDINIVLGLQYISFCVVMTSGIIPLLITIPSLTYHYMMRTGTTILLWWLLCTLQLFLLVADVSFNEILVVFAVTSASPPLLLGISIMTGLKKSRIGLLGTSSLRSVKLELFIGIVYAVCVFGYLASRNSQFIFSLSLGTAFTLTILPFVSYRALQADTKYWRITGKINVGGIVLTESHVDSPAEQKMNPDSVLNDYGHSLIDFAHIEIGEVCSRGSTAVVYIGKYLKYPSSQIPISVTLKVWMPFNMVETELQSMSREMNLAKSLSHPCIVNCYGLCVCPPQLAMVMELCGQGSLHISLSRNKEDWTTSRKLRAGLDASRALGHMHSKGFVHNNISLESFLVTNDWLVKLGDLGNSTATVRESQSQDSNERMLLSAAVYTAPELLGDNYTTDSASHSAADVYALGFILLQLWTDGANPYGDMDAFAIYDAIDSGTRPAIPESVPSDVVTAIRACWSHNAADRPTAHELENMLQISFDSFSARALDVSSNIVANSGDMQGNAIDTMECGYVDGKRSALKYGVSYGRVADADCAIGAKSHSSATARSNSPRPKDISLSLQSEQEGLTLENIFPRNVAHSASGRGVLSKSRSFLLARQHQSERVNATTPKEAQFRAWQDTRIRSHSSSRLDNASDLGEMGSNYNSRTVISRSNTPIGEFYTREAV